MRIFTADARKLRRNEIRNLTKFLVARMISLWLDVFTN